MSAGRGQKCRRDLWVPNHMKLSDIWLPEKKDEWFTLEVGGCGLLVTTPLTCPVSSGDLSLGVGGHPCSGVSREDWRISGVRSFDERPDLPSSRRCEGVCPCCWSGGWTCREGGTGQNPGWLISLRSCCDDSDGCYRVKIQ